MDDIDYTTEGESIIPYNYDMNEDNTYGIGYISLGSDVNHQVKFFQVEASDDDELNRQISIKNRCCGLHFESLLVPLVIERYGNYIDIGYSFTQSLQQWIDVGDVYPLFEEENGIMHQWWIEQLTKLFNTLMVMHEGFLYHGGLSHIENFVIEDNSLCIVKANHLRDARDEELERADKAALGVFFRALLDRTQGHLSLDWDDFLDNFDGFAFKVIKRHPVLKDGTTQYDITRRLITRVQNSWQLSKEGSFVLYSFIEENLPQYDDWSLKIPRGSIYETVYDYKGGNDYYDTTSCVSMLLYVENAMKHLKRDRTRDEIAKDLKMMFPGLFSHLHSACAAYDVEHPSHNIFPIE